MRFLDCRSLRFSPLCFKIVGQNCVIFAYFAQVKTKTKAQTKTLETIKSGSTKHCCIFHGIGSTASTDQRECGFMIVGLFICPFVPKKCGPKMGDFWLFCTDPDLWNQKMGSD